MEAAAGPDPVSVYEDAASTVQPMQTTASHHAEEIREIAQPEHEQMAIERAERERMIEEEGDRLDREREARIAELEARLAQVWPDFEGARALEAGRKERERSEDLERYEAIRTQPSDITNTVQEQQDEHARKEELMDERWNEKMNRRVEKDTKIGNPYDIVTRTTEDREAERGEERIATESRPGTKRVLEEPVHQDVERRELLDQIAEGRKNSLARDREEILAITREAPSDWVPGGCLCRETTYTFSKAPQNIPGDFNYDANYVVPGGKDGSNKWAGSHCYCGSCRVSVGALVVTWITVRREQFKLEKKGPTTVYRSSSHATREFRSTCGTSLFFHDADEPEFIDITLGSVSAENLSEYIQVTAHIWLGDAEEQTLRSEGEGLGLAAIINDGLPRWKRGRGSERL